MVYRMAFSSRRRWTHFLPVAMLVLASAACSGGPAVEKKRQFEKGAQYLKDGKYNEAVIAFRNALQIDPNDADTHYQLGRTYRRKGWIIDARNDFEKAVQGRPDFRDARYELGQVLLESGLPVEAEKAARELLKAEASPRAQTLLGNSLTAQRKLDDAQRAFDAAVAADPRYADALAGKGTANLVQGKPAEAQREFVQALALDGQNIEAHLGLGRVAAQGKRFDEAQREFEKVLQADPD